MRAIGENPSAVDATGINVLKRQRQALLIVRSAVRARRRIPVGR